MRRLVVALVVAVDLAAVALVVHWNASRASRPPAPPTALASAWDALEPQARCESASRLVVHPDRWPTVCRWRQPEDVSEGTSYPPPEGEPPFDNPHVEIYVDPSESREDVAHAIAHEFGHMHHTRDAQFLREWLVARGLPLDTSEFAWTEDYAEVFAALFGPKRERWLAPTPRPSAEALTRLHEQFFS